MLRQREFEEKQPGKKRAGMDLSLRSVLTLIYAFIFGVLSGVIIAVALSVFIPEFYTEWAGSLVCSGKVEYVTFKQTYYCYVSPNNALDIGNAMFWAVFKRFV